MIKRIKAKTKDGVSLLLFYESIEQAKQYNQSLTDFEYI
jgi:hypothetical protein